MDDIEIESGSLKARSVGVGQPVLLIHGAFAPDIFGPMIKNERLAAYRFVEYRRRGHIDSAANVEGESLADYARDALAVVDHYGLEQVDVVGHSYGGRIALEVARLAPSRVHTLIVLEPGAPPDLEVPDTSVRNGFVESAAAYKAGMRSEALDIALAGVGGPSSRVDLSAVLRDGWYDQAVEDLGVLFNHELPAQWGLRMSDLAAMGMPSCVVQGEHSKAFFAQVCAAVAEELPDCQTVTAPGATHWLPAGWPDAVAPVLADFLDQHPLPD